MMASKREPEVIIFQEPTFKRRKKGREAARERERFLVSLFFNDRMMIDGDLSFHPAIIFIIPRVVMFQRYLVQSVEQGSQ